MYDHDRKLMSSVRRDDSDPRALAYVYQQQDAYLLFYIKTANLVMTHIEHIDNRWGSMFEEKNQFSACVYGNYIWVRLLGRRGGESSFICYRCKSTEIGLEFIDKLIDDYKIEI